MRRTIHRHYSLNDPFCTAHIHYAVMLARKAGICGVLADRTGSHGNRWRQFIENSADSLNRRRVIRYDGD